MWLFKLILLLYVYNSVLTNEDDLPVLYYYGLEESERGLSACSERQACGALLRRAWRAPALLRLCRCARRRRCDSPAPELSRVYFNNRAHLQFCRPVYDWPRCAFGHTALTVETDYDRINPDEVEQLHHKNIQLTPPKLVFNCRCLEPNYWKLNSTTKTTKFYQCQTLPLCKTAEFCGNVDYDLNGLYQSCLCPPHHICTHNGGVPNTTISELLYHGPGWPSYCERVVTPNTDMVDSYED